MRILFACGGTAGHINPALSIAATIRQREPGAELRFAGNPTGMEARLVGQAGFDFVPFRAMGIQRKLTGQNILRNIRSLGLLATSQPRAKKLIRDFAPQLVVGTGGYVSGPILMAAAAMGIPTVTHEQNAFPGITTKMLARRVDKVLLAVEKAREYLPKDISYVVTGNPVRPQLLTQDRAAARRSCGVGEGQLCILSFGGSLGAQRVNEAIAEVMAWHAGTGKVHHIHATGQYGVELLPRLLEQRRVPYRGNRDLDIREYIDNMPVCLAAADLVICRAGAITLSELEVMGRASILIPSPNVAENHQYHNAMVLHHAGAALVLEEKDLTGSTLVTMIQELAADPRRLTQLGHRARTLGRPDAAQQIADQVLALLPT